MKELIVISGKGGTGKTSLVAAFASLAERKVLCDADVDAADLHLITRPDASLRADFIPVIRRLLIKTNVPSAHYVWTSAGSGQSATVSRSIP